MEARCIVRASEVNDIDGIDLLEVNKLIRNAVRVVKRYEAFGDNDIP